MATKKAASAKRATAKKSAAAKTTVRTIHADTTKIEPVDRTVTTSTAKKSGVTASLPSNTMNIVLAELVGTFVLTIVALATSSLTESGALYVGIAWGVLSLAIGAISGSHINPAVTFGLWAMRRLKTILLPFYWGAQLLGAMLAVIIVNWVSNNAISLNFGHFANFSWGIFGCELIAAAVLMFGYAAVISHRDLSAGAKAVGIGAALALGLVAGGSVLTLLKAQDVTAYQKAASSTTSSKATPEIPHSAYIKGVVANPAVALATTDHAANELVSSSTDSTTYSRFTLEVILGTLVGAALGGNLYLLITGRKQD